MSFTINYTDMPGSIRKQLAVRYIYPYDNLDLFRVELAKFHCEYTDDNKVIFESEAHYTWFVLRWS
jgi:hypothetical protein